MPDRRAQLAPGCSRPGQLTLLRCLEFMEDVSVGDRAALAPDQKGYGRQMLVVPMACEGILDESQHSIAAATHAVVPGFAFQLVTRNCDGIHATPSTGNAHAAQSYSSQVCKDSPQWRADARVRRTSPLSGRERRARERHDARLLPRFRLAPWRAATDTLAATPSWSKTLNQKKPWGRPRRRPCAGASNPSVQVRRTEETVSIAAPARQPSREDLQATVRDEQ
jgi:hypothetical protein